MRALAVAPAALEIRGAQPSAIVGRSSSSARSYLGDGHWVLWTPVGLPDGAHVAVDAEDATRPVPAGLARRTGVGASDDFWPLWTSMEVACKLRDVPVTVWLRRHGLRADPNLASRTFRLDDLVVTCGVLVSEAQAEEVRRVRTAGGPAPSPG